MRFAALVSFIWLALISPAVVLAAEDASTDSNVDKEGSESTVFNGQTVPHMKDLLGQTINEDIAEGYWLVEFFSPYCHHCKALAPTWQTLYEFYYTSKQHLSSQQDADSLNSFTRYYDFRFAKLDCVAFGTACSDKDVHSFPTLIIFKNGEKVKDSVGVKSLKELSDWIEETLESIRPGSRPKSGVTLPDVDAKSVDNNAKPDTPVAKDKNPAEGAAAGEKHNALAQRPKKKGLPNVNGTSVVFDAEKFQNLVTLSQDPWFVKFYAPWCHHCLAMGPHWTEMAREMQGALNVGEVNCDIEKRLCKDARVKGFPTLLFFKGGERIEYEGLRGVGDLITFAKKAVDVGSGIRDIDASTFEEMEKTEEVIFLYVYDHATTTEDFQALERLTLSLIGRAKIVKSKDPKLAERFKISTWPRLLVSRDGKPSYYTPLAPKDMRDVGKVLDWMRTVWLPIVPELTATNAREIMDGKIVVLAILSRERSDEFTIARREMKNAALEWIDRQTHAFQLERQELRDAKQLRIEEATDRNDQRALRAAKNIRINMDEIERKEVRFAWVDGVFWERWVRTTYGIDVKDGEKVIINDEENKRYWDSTVTGNPIVPSRTSILETLPRVIANPPKIAYKSTSSSIERVFFTIRNSWSRHPWLNTLGFIIIAVFLVFISRGRSRRGKNFGGSGYFQLDGDKGGLLGGFSSAGTNGKVD